MGDTNREVFEKWFESRPLFKKLVYTQNKPIFNFDMHLGEYEVTTTQLAWEAWQEQHNRAVAYAANPNAHIQYHEESMLNLPIDYSQARQIKTALGFLAHVNDFEKKYFLPVPNGADDGHHRDALFSKVQQIMDLFDRGMPF